MNNRLGKGIEALINTHSTSDSLVNGSIPIDNIIPNHNQPRQSFEDKEMQNLSQRKEVTLYSSFIHSIISGKSSITMRPKSPGRSHISRHRLHSCLHD